MNVSCLIGIIEIPQQDESVQKQGRKKRELDSVNVSDGNEDPDNRCKFTTVLHTCLSNILVKLVVQWRLVTKPETTPPTDREIMSPRVKILLHATTCFALTHPPYYFQVLPGLRES